MACIKQCFLEDIPIRSVRRYLNREGTPKHPFKRVFEQRTRAARTGLKRITLRSLPTQRLWAKILMEGTNAFWSAELYPYRFMPLRGKPGGGVSEQKGTDQSSFYSDRPQLHTVHALLKEDNLGSPDPILRHLIKVAG